MGYGWVMLSGLQIFRVKHSYSKPIKKNNSLQKKKKHTNEREKEAEAMDTPDVERHRTFSWCSLHWAFTDTSSHQTFKSTFNKANKNTRAAQ